MSGRPLADYERGAKLDPRLAVVELARGKTLLVAGRYTEARAALDRFLANHPNHAEARAARARVLVKLGQNRAAVEDYTRAIDETVAVERAMPEYYLERARASAAQGEAYVSEALRGLDDGGKVTAHGRLQVGDCSAHALNEQTRNAR